MREIKFRAWNEKANRHSKPFTLKSRVLNYTDDDGLGVTMSLTCEIVEQFTGLQDKNGTDIYEGDILWPKAQDARKVIYPMSESVACFGLVTACGKKITLGNSDKLYTIIGNIHQNPELIK
tara:strand:+ start:56 stop:418 length:363 start_codon:yes stop_codon:yes gene_type:complete